MNPAEFARHMQGQQHVYDVQNESGDGSHELCPEHVKTRMSNDHAHDMMGLSTGLTPHDSPERPQFSVTNPHQGRCRDCAQQVNQSNRHLDRLVRQENPGGAGDSQRARGNSPYSNLPSSPWMPRKPNTTEEFKPNMRSMSVQTPPDGMSFEHIDRETGGSKHPIVRQLRAVHPEHGLMGSVDYYPPKRSNGRVAIDSLYVNSDHRRKGVGSALMDQVQKMHPDSTIDHGDRTDDGQSWWSGYSDGKQVRRGRTAMSDDDYRMRHRPGGPSDEEEGTAAPAHALDRVFPKDVYTHPHYYGGGEGLHGGPKAFKETVNTLRQIRGNPEAPVTMYRSLPPEHASKGFRTGDWVSVHPEYARGHGLHAEDENKDWPVIKQTVPAKHLWNNGDSLDEFGYHGPHVPGEVHFPGGRDAKIPKTGGVNGSVLMTSHAATSGFSEGNHFAERLDKSPEEEPYIVPRFHNFARDYTAPSGQNYRLLHGVGAGGDTTVTAHHQLANGKYRGAGYLSWFGGKPRYDSTNIDGGVIYKAHVSQSHRRRGIASAMLDFAREKHPEMDIRHSDALTEDGKAWSEKKATRYTPNKRVFTATCGLDHRLFDGDHLRTDVRKYIMRSVTAMWARFNDISKWSIVYFAGSEASEWTDTNLEGNNDFDVLIGVDYDKFRKANPKFIGLDNTDITNAMNSGFRAYNGPVILTIDGKNYGPFDRTTYVNPDSYDIKKIKPYAAYNVSDDVWTVKPPHLPHWSLSELPRAVQRVLRACDTLANDVLKLPEPERTQQGNALFQAWHSDRSRAFSDRGEGWFDIANLREKWLDQEGVWAELTDCAHRWTAGEGMAAADWSNTPRGYTASYAEYQRDKMLEKAKNVSDPEQADRVRQYAHETHDFYSSAEGHPHRKVGEPWVHPHNGEPMKVGWVKTEHMLPYAAHSGYQRRDSQDTIRHLSDDFKSTGFQSPIELHYHPETHSARIEGNHRLEAARRAGLSHVPVMVHVEDRRASDRSGDDSYEPAKFPKPARQFQEPFEIVHPKEVLPHEWLHPENPPKTSAALDKSNQLFGKGEIHHMFPVDEDGPASRAPSPWPQASRSKNREDFDMGIVQHALSNPHDYPSEEVDPRDLHSRQPSVTRAGVQHYMSDTYRTTGTTFADQHNPINRRPVIYKREDGQNLILSGHHRGAAALLKGEPMHAVVLHGPWGKPR